MLRQKAWNYGVKIWNWSICQWGLQTIKNLSLLSSKFFFFILIFLKKNKTVHLQSYLPCLDNNLSKNNGEKTFGATKPDKNSDLLYP